MIINIGRLTLMAISFSLMFALWSPDSFGSGRQIPKRKTENSNPPSSIKVESKEFIIGSKTIAVTECLTETSWCDGNYCPRAYYSKTILESVLTVVRDLITQEVLFKGESERFTSKVEEFKSESAYYRRGDASNDYEKLLARCNSRRKTDELEIEKNKTASEKGPS